MKKIYNSPKLESVMLFASDVIAASLLMGIDGEENGKFKVIHELEL